MFAMSWTRVRWGVMCVEWHGVSVLFSVVEICVGYGGVYVFQICFDLCVVYGVGIYVNVWGVIWVVEYCLFLASGCCLLWCNVVGVWGVVICILHRSGFAISAIKIQRMKQIFIRCNRIEH